MNGTADNGLGGYFANNSSSGYPAVEAVANATSGASVAVYANSSSGYGVEGMSSSNTGVYGVLSGPSSTGRDIGPSGVWGDTSASYTTNDSAGVSGSADDNTAGAFWNNSDVATLTASNLSTDPSAVVFDAYSDSDAGGDCSINAAGIINCNGVNINVRTGDGSDRRVTLHSVQSPENWFEDFGSGTLVNGAATVALDPTFASTVNTTTDYHVFLTPKGDCKGPYVANETAGGFQVRELGGGRSSVAFDYRIVAKRAGYENARLEDVTERYQKMREQERVRQERMQQRRAARSAAAPAAPPTAKVVAPSVTPAASALSSPPPHR